MNNDFDLLGLMQGPLQDEYKEHKYDELSGMEYSPFTPMGGENMGQQAMNNQMMGMDNNMMIQSLTPGNIEIHNNLQSLRTPPEFSIKSELSPHLDMSQDGNNANRRRTASASTNGKAKAGEEMSEDKKKAQNRAAQRAFRERKEAKFKELQRKVRESEIDRDQLLKELEKLRKWNMEINAENRKLLQKERFGINNGGVYGGAGVNGGSPSSQSLPNIEGPDTTYIFPSTNECFEQAVNQRDNVSEQSLERKPVYSAAGRFLQYQDEFPDDTLLTVPETWEYLSQLSENEEFDVNEVMEKLVGLEQCHPSGPAYSKIRIDSMVKQSIENNR